MAEPAVQDTVEWLHVARACYFNNNENFNANDRNINNANSAVRGIAQDNAETLLFMAPEQGLWYKLCSYENLFLAYNKARKHKTTKDYVVEFEKNLTDNLLLLRSELLLHCYQPKPLVNFTIRDPKTRKISKSDFRDRVVHHALCNVIEPIFERGFIYDSYANRVSKGTLNALKRFDYFKRKVSRNNTIKCYVLKADIRKYFENVDHGVLISIIKKKVADPKVIWLIKKILANSSQKNKGMPLGNLTSQFFGNVYLNELDWFVKRTLKVKYYIRYVDDFVILGDDKGKLEFYKWKIDGFLNECLKLFLHPHKSKIFRLGNSFPLLGFRVFFYHKLLKKSNPRMMKNMLQTLKEKYYAKKADYDVLYDFLEGWIAYTKNADTFKLRKRILADFERQFPGEISTKEINRYFKALEK